MQFIKQLKQTFFFKVMSSLNYSFILHLISASNAAKTCGEKDRTITFGFFVKGDNLEILKILNAQKNCLLGIFV